MRRVFTALTVGVAASFLLAGSLSAAGAPVSPRQAKKLLFKGDKIMVQLLDPAGLNTVTKVQVETVAKSLTSPAVAKQWEAMGFSILYYGAIAVMPDRPLSDKTMSISYNLHSPEAAAAAAVRACNALKGPDCVAAALILPKRYKPREFTLSQAATNGFRENWGRPKEPEFLAYSPSTPAFTIVKGAGGDTVALNKCNENSEGANDCVIGIAEQ